MSISVTPPQPVYHHFICNAGGFKGSVMRWAHAPLPGATKRLLILPGWGEWLEKYEDAIAAWQQRGYEVFMVEWRGQGLSSRFLPDSAMAWLPSLEVLVEDLAAFFAAHLTDNPLPLHLFCHSLGAHLGLRWCYAKPQQAARVERMVLAAILHRLKPKPFPNGVAKAIARLGVYAGFGKHYAFGQAGFNQGRQYFPKNVLTHDATRFGRMMAQLQANPNLAVGGMSFGFIDAAFRSIAALEKSLAKSPPATPCLLLIPEDDPLVESAAMHQLAQALPHSQKAVFSNANHELLQEIDAIRTAVWEEIDRFLESYQRP